MAGTFSVRFQLHPSMAAGLWALACLAAALGFCCGCGARNAYDSPVTDYVQAQQSLAEDAARRESSPPTSSVESMSRIFADLDNSQQTAVAIFWSGILDAYGVQAKRVKNDLMQDRSELVANWKALRIRSAETEAVLTQLQLEEYLPWICRLSQAGWLMVVSAVATFGSLVLALSRVWRRRVPRRFSNLPRVTMFVIIPSLYILALSSGWIVPRLAGTRASGIAHACGTLARELAEIETFRNPGAAVPDFSKPGTGRSVTLPGDPRLPSDLETKWRVAAGEITTVLRETQINRSMANGYEADTKRLAQDIAAMHQQGAKLKQFRERERNVLPIVTLICLLITIVATFLPLWVRRQEDAMREESADVCPCCGLKGKYKEINIAGPDEPPVLDRVCENKIGQRGAPCDFRFDPNFANLARLRIGVMGHPQSGKTHTIAETIFSLRPGNHKTGCEFTPVPTERLGFFNRVIEDLRRRGVPRATLVEEITDPVVYSFLDNDYFWGRSSALLSIFDYSGEITASQVLEDQERRRALNAQGFLYFLDPIGEGVEDGACWQPTAPSHLAQELSNQMEKFRHDIPRMARSRNIPRPPAAICIPKIDLLPRHETYLHHGNGPIDVFYQGLFYGDRLGHSVSLKQISRRSDMVSHLLSYLWPGLDIEENLRHVFGNGRYMFFPLSPVGMVQEELGERDLSNRTLAPFGILQPLFWLLHMNGYVTLK